MQKLIRQDAQKNNINVDSAEVDVVLNNFKQSKDSAEVNGYQKFLGQVKLSEKDLRAQIEISQLYDNLIYLEQLKNNADIKDFRSQ